jgi:TonB family protein
MKPASISLFACLLLWGCGSTESVDMPEVMPRLIEQEPFPPMSEALVLSHSELDLRILISEDGSVLKAQLINPSTDAAWDSLAGERMKEWKFSPAIHRGKPIAMWINFHAHVKFEIPVYVGLAEIECGTAELADSVFTLLQAGKNFDSLVSSFSISKSKENHGQLGQVDISRYGDRVKRILTALKGNGYTEPIALGEHFVIFKRLAADARFD